MIYRLVLITALCLASMTSVSAQQKLAHVNFGNVLSVMPEVKTADGILASLNDSLGTVLEKQTEEFRTLYEKVRADVENLTPIQLQQEQAKLKGMQTEIEQLQQRIPQMIEVRRGQLLAPVVQRAKAAIEKIARARGYDIVMDSSIFNAVLFVAEGNDLTEAVQAALK
ncbi:OmpH family outer membrane protein [Lewinella sp. 4G2]|uniref:OmpH family outer membrane protein n=1 Tax=Lewinella sp. 4G2 TaxID=1803372 RepID=UPI0007B47008|nr:OmpH family outer membrane protein [Lewinella sp. 4G2]OAV43034.1 hypothetical protein A3850_000305 [Lewinella sp. 4G2]